MDLEDTAQSCTVSSSITQRILHIGAAEAANSTSSCHELDVVVSGVSSSSVSVRGQAVEQSAEMRSALEFFATGQSFRERSLESVNRVTEINFFGV